MTLGASSVLRHSGGHCCTKDVLALSILAQPYSVPKPRCGHLGGQQRLNIHKIACFTTHIQAIVSYEQTPADESRAGTLAATRIPPSSETLSLGPNVAHLAVPEDSTLLETITQQLQLPKAVHWSPVPPARKASSSLKLDSEQTKQAAAQYDAARKRFGKQPIHVQPQRAAKDVLVNQYAYIRLHLHPKRFPAVYSVDWKSCVVYECPRFVVVDKPAGVQVIPTVDNVLENVLACTTQALQLPQQLLVTHRLDSCTQGLVVLGKTTAFVQLFNNLLQQPGGIRKFYKTLTQFPPPVGQLQHFIKTGEHAKGQASHSVIAPGPGPGIQHCSLEVLQVQHVPLSAAAAAAWGPTAYESLLELHTGRTHQIRVQLAAVGCPLYGDSLYALQTAPETLQVCKEPVDAIGLQACKLLLQETDELQLCFTARHPWWASQSDQRLP